MSRPALIKQKEIYFEVLSFVAIFLILLLASLNISAFLGRNKVLGASTESANLKTDAAEEKFWKDFLNRNPNYIPGLIETGLENKAREIDPNYLITSEVNP